MKTIRKAIAKLINWALRDEYLEVGSIGVCHPRTTFTDSIVPKSADGVVTITRLAVNSGDAFPTYPVPIQGQLFFKYTATPSDGYLFIFLGVGRTGCTDGWFNVSQAIYAP